MAYYNFRKHKFLGFRISQTKNKKYDAIIQNKQTGAVIIIPFGDKRHKHYRDVALGNYEHLDHLDVNRRILYHSRHKHYIKPGYYSPGYFSSRFLW